MGGSLDGVFRYVKSNGVCSSESYPYLARLDSCRANSCTKVLGPGVVLDTGYVPKGSTSAFIAALQDGPISVLINADQVVFTAYRSGIIPASACTESPLNHAVLLVGYGVLDGKRYWRIKNSWGSWWGNGGYAYMERLGDDVVTLGPCGLLYYGRFHVLKYEPPDRGVFVAVVLVLLLMLVIGIISLIIFKRKKISGRVARPKWMQKADHPESIVPHQDDKMKSLFSSVRDVFRPVPPQFNGSHLVGPSAHVPIYLQKTRSSAPTN